MAAISSVVGAPVEGLRQVGGGSFSENWRSRSPSLFIKLSVDADRLAAEADGLDALNGCGAFRIPRVMGLGSTSDGAFLAMEWLDLAPVGDWQSLALALAAQHRTTGPQYGWRRNNYLGATPQANPPSAEWLAFFLDRRLRPQVERALLAGFRDIEKPLQGVEAALPEILGNHRPMPSLLHGDFWSGNVGDAGGRPCAFDPAVHYGDAECDLAMAALFGGFPQAFFEGYAGANPPVAGWSSRRRLYQLYHLINHLNLFGGGYLGQVIDAARSVALPPSRARC